MYGGAREPLDDWFGHTCEDENKKVDQKEKASIRKKMLTEAIVASVYVKRSGGGYDQLRRELRNVHANRSIE